MRWLPVVITLFIAATAEVFAAEPPILIPLVTDPSPVVDGNLQEAARRGVLLTLDRKEQVTYGAAAWNGPQDLTGWVRLGHDDENLYVACHVADDVISQEGTGVDMWKGDHVIVFLDFVRSGKKEDIIEAGISPGNLKAPGAPGSVKPDFVIFEPQGWDSAGASVASTRTADGYNLEAAIPWKLLKIKPIKYQTFAMDVAFSDSDEFPPRQKACMSFSPAPWNTYDPKRLIPAGLADQTGFLPPDSFQKAQLLAKELVIRMGQPKELNFDAGKAPEGLIPTLTFKARVDSPTCGGCAGPLLTTVNGKPISPANIANRPPEVTFMNGGTQSTWYGHGVTLWFGPSYAAVEKSGYKALEVATCDYTLRLDNLIQPGRNKITLQNKDERDLQIVMDDVSFGWFPPSSFKAPKELAPAPTGPLTAFEPAAEQRVDYKVAALPGGAIKLSWKDRELTLISRFSKPGGAWAEWKADKAEGWDSSAPAGGKGSFLHSKAGALEVSREVVPGDECFLVRDTLKNTSDQLLSVIVYHQTAPGPYQALYLAGRPVPSKSGLTSSPENPSVAVLAKDSGFALAAHDDIFRIHFLGSCDAQTASLNDSSLVLQPGVSYTQEWLVFPLAQPDYWRYVNAARRYFKTNFTIPGSFCFFDLQPGDDKLLPWEAADYLDRKGAYFASMGLFGTYKGLFPHGPNDRTLDPRKAQLTNKLVKLVRPQTKILTYFNCFDCARAPGDPVRWPDCRMLTPDGKQIFDGADYPLYFPTLTNEYGKEMDKSLDWLLNVVGAEGLYWDCYFYNYSHYGEPWDGCSGDLDPAQHTLIRKRSSTALISWPWRERLTARLLKEGRPLVANSNPCTTSEMQYHFPRFVETADITALCAAHLFTPIALGDHITERNEVDSYHWMLNALNWGGLYYWYSSAIIPTHPTLTTYMFPFTPIELHAGWLVGEERILTNRSGLFGWGDASQFQAHVFDRVGKETTEIKVPLVVRDGKNYAEVRVPEGYSAAIVRVVKQ